MNAALCTDEKLFTFLQQRWQDAGARGYPQIDTLLIPLLRMFNQLNGVVTIFSCSSHLASERSVTEPADDAFYLLLGYRPEGLEALHRIFVWTDDRWPKDLKRRLVFAFSRINTRGVLTSEHTLEVGPVYNGLRFGYRFTESDKHEQNRTRLLDHLTQAVEHELARQRQGA